MILRWRYCQKKFDCKNVTLLNKFEEREMHISLHVPFFANCFKNVCKDFIKLFPSNARAHEHLKLFLRVSYMSSITSFTAQN